ncbi:hypothetical protein RB11299 [Rhodopirellula baltica SH 1]|uniref:Uncharacterized protein n=1 Tax=Rhodopirellula baltica (strain DSM 10527 / NCIMB 13988 / SH1) TaxID=243090 RepID=Q7UEJ4_RHOBA|nr:hypothetical protein RB11299 [Rhodopirellula baltica SH 1]
MITTRSRASDPIRRLKRQGCHHWTHGERTLLIRIETEETRFSSDQQE